MITTPQSLQRFQRAAKLLAKPPTGRRAHLNVSPLMKDRYPKGIQRNKQINENPTKIVINQNAINQNKTPPNFLCQLKLSKFDILPHTLVIP